MAKTRDGATAASAVGAETGARADEERLPLHFARMANASLEAIEKFGALDHVTGLPTRRALMRDFDAIVAGGSRTLVLVTLAEPLHYNKLVRALGHSYAEDFLRAGANRLASRLPEGTPFHHVGPLSFTFLLPDAFDGDAPPIVRDVIGAFRASIVCRDIPVDTRIGVGIASIAEHVDAAELLRAALTAAMDSRKGFAGWAAYDRRADEAHVRAFRLLSDLPKALAATDQLALAFQPRVSMQDGRCSGAEALLRWNHPRFGAVPPSEFVALAESTALITPLTRWVISNGLKAAARWRREKRQLRLSLNVSPRNLEEPQFVDLLLFEMSRYDLDPEEIELEFTEGALATDPALMLDRLCLLRRKGFHIAIDDFGSGYSNMMHLGALPARVLKIDRAFMQSLEADRKKQLLVRSIIDLAHALDYGVVAEGIESRAVYGLLCAWDCDEGQGYFMSPPLSFAAFGEWFDAKGARQVFYE